ncbi:hypothetical protein [Tenggerimyces flavus]|uniref:LPXTG cell wall anchor domain-containing protein n=1 Tax=Tenggerimyces flavus TaxID=1708749 RepID=A0ABV7YA48_9ACTN|nr:hypothetical protein [Tenggerimyces flavus]MBM7785370.1 H+/gluconate symporter-like permease [Tenggerimyces flavus]
MSLIKQIMIAISAIAASLAVIAGTLKLLAWLGVGVIALLVAVIILIWVLRKRKKDKKSYYQHSTKL